MKAIVACLRTFSLVALTLLLTKCQFTLTTRPDFTTNGEAILNAIQSKYGAEAVDVKKSEQSGKDNQTAVVISVINGQRLPAEDKLNETGGEIASQVKGALQHPEEFDAFKVLFVTKRGMFTHSKGFEYSLTANQ